MNNWKRIAAPLLVFFLGVLFGVGGSAIFAVRTARHFLALGPRASVEVGSRWVQRRLDLTPAQRADLAPVLAAAEQDFEQMRREDIVRSHRILEAAAAKIRPTLDAAQQRKLDTLLSGPRARWAALDARERDPASGN